MTTLTTTRKKMTLLDDFDDCVVPETTKALSNARVAFDVARFSCERFFQSKRLRARFVGGENDDDDDDDDVEAIAFVDDSSGESLRRGVGLSAFLETSGCANVVDMMMEEEKDAAKDVRSIRTGERVASTAPLVFFIGTTLAESGEKIVRICGERPEASMVTVLVSTCKETQHAGAREVREAFDLCVKDLERLILEKVGGDTHNTSNGDGDGKEQQKTEDASTKKEEEEEEDDWDEDWGDDDW